MTKKKTMTDELLQTANAVLDGKTTSYVVAACILAKYVKEDLESRDEKMRSLAFHARLIGIQMCIRICEMYEIAGQSSKSSIVALQELLTLKEL